MAAVTHLIPANTVPDHPGEPARSTFFGRETALDAIAQRLNASAHRLLTVTGPAGIGKSRLVRRSINRLGDAAFDGPIWYCDCALASDTHGMCAAAARSLDLVVGSAAGVDDVAGLVGRALAAHRAPLLVLDNLEHLLPQAGEVLSCWLDAAPECRLLVTSREILHVEGECVFELGPLPEAAELFLNRARLIRPEYASSEADRRIVAQLAARLDGIPLAVELAAARARVLSPSALLQQIEARLEILSQGRGVHGARQSTMREALAWSWDLLDPTEQRAMAALSVFRGGFCLDDAQQLLSDTHLASAEDALDLVQALRDKSLLHAAETLPEDGSTRFGIYEVVRSYARARLEEYGMTAAASESHAAHFVGRGERLIQGCSADRLDTAIDRLALDRENLESILERGATDPQHGVDMLSLSLRSAVLLGAVSGEDGLPPAQIQQLDRLLDQPASGAAPGLLLQARLVRDAKHVYSGHPARAELDCRAIIAQGRALGQDRLAASAHLTLGAALLRQGKAAEAWDVLRQAEALFRGLGDVAGEQHALCQQGGCAHSLQRREEALSLFGRGLQLAQAWSFLRGEIRAQAGLGSHFLEAGDYDASRKHLDRCGELARASGFRRTAILVMGHLGILNFDHARLGEALECTTAAVAEAGETGDDVALGVFLAVESAIRAAMGDAEGALPLAAKAQRILAASPLFRIIVEVYAGHIDLALSRTPGAVGVPAVREDRLEQARRRIQQASTAEIGSALAVEQSDDLRIALRILSRAVSQTHGALPGTRASASAQAKPLQAALCMGAGATWFQIEGERRVDMSRRNNSKAILRGLAEHSLDDQASSLSVDDLLAIGWPGEKMARSSALNRLYVALATLRSLGLRDVIERRPHGYALNARVRWE